MLQIAIVDDSEDIRALFRAQLVGDAELQVCAEGADGQSAIDIARRLQPDVMLLDLSMPGMSGLDALPLILAASPDTAVIVLSGFGRRGFADAAYALGARGFLEKNLPVGSLSDRVLAVLRGEPAEPARSSGPW